jgi:diphthine-ammonia ligase
LKLASLYSGGKDSNYSIFEINRSGHDVVCLVSILPAESDSLLFHFPNISLSAVLAQAIDLPIRSFQSTAGTLGDEKLVLENALANVIDEFNVQGIVHGGLCSNFQKKNFEKVCQKLGLSVFSPLWHVNPAKYLHKMIDEQFKIVIVGVSALGLEENGLARSWITKT